MSKINQREDIKRNKYCLFPLKYPNIFEYYRLAASMYWTAEEINLSEDYTDWKYKLKEDERFFIKHILAFFAQSDGIVNENLLLRFYKEIDIPEVSAFYTIQMAIETIHSHIYSLLIDTYIKDLKEQRVLFNAIENVDVIKRKAKWIFKWLEGNQSFVERLVAFSFVEGIFFSGSFCSIFWLRKKGVLPGLTASNDLIARDEGLHWEFAVLLYKELGLKISKEKIYEIIQEAVEIEKEFVTKSLPVSLIGMNATLMCTYIEYVADIILSKYGFKPIYKVNNPFDFMIMIDLTSKTNFFEKRNTDYKIVKKTNMEMLDEF